MFIVGVAVDDIAGGRDEGLGTNHLQAEETFHFRGIGKWGKRKFCRRVIVQAADGSCAR